MELSGASVIIKHILLSCFFILGFTLSGFLFMTYWIFVALVLLGMVVALGLPRYRLKKAIAAPFPQQWIADPEIDSLVEYLPSNAYDSKNTATRGALLNVQ